MYEIPKYVWAIKAVVTGLIGPIVAPLVLNSGWSADVAFAAAGVLGYLGALTCDLVYVVMREHYENIQRGHNLRRAMQAHQTPSTASGSRSQLLQVER